jgi:hypothetical protein
LQLPSANLASQIQSSTASFTLINQTGAQPYLGNTAQGGVYLAAGFYEYETTFHLIGLSSTSGTFGWTLGGNATIYQQLNHFHCVKTASVGTQQAWVDAYTASGGGALTPSNTLSDGVCVIGGKIRISGAGTLIPEVTLGVASAASVGPGAFFEIRQLSPNYATNFIGNWQ